MKFYINHTDKIQLLIKLVIILALTFAVSFGLTFIFDNPLFVFITPFLIIPLIILLPSLASKKTEVRVENESLIFGNQTILFTKLNGYFFEKQQTLFHVHLISKNNKTITFTTNLKGKKRKEFDLFFTYFLETIEKTNPSFRFISYKEFYKKQHEIVKPLMILLLIIVISYDIWYYFQYLEEIKPDIFKLIVLNLVAIASLQFLFNKSN